SAGSYDCVVSSALGGTTATTTSTTATLSVNSPPAIGQQPVSATVAAGANATFTVAATGNGTRSYRRSKGGTPIPGATAATLALPGATSSDEGSYACTVSNSLNGTTTSTTAEAATLAPNTG